MKSIYSLLVLAAVCGLLAIGGCSGGSSSSVMGERDSLASASSPFTTELIAGAGQGWPATGEDVGGVSVWNDGTYLYVKYTADNGWYFGEDGSLAQIECIRMVMGEKDAKGRRKPVPVEGSNFIVEADTAILALGYWPDPIIGETTPDLKTHKYGLIVVDRETGATSRPGVYAGGDDVTGPDLVVTAMAAGRRAAAAISSYLAS